MSAIRRYTLDANILFYAVDTDDHSKHLIADQVVEAALNADCFVTMQALCELYNAISKKRPRHRSQAQQLITLLSGSMPVVSASPLDLAVATKQHERRPIQFWDTLLWATARRHGCRTVVTEDAQDRPAIDGVRYLNPFAASPGNWQICCDLKTTVAKERVGGSSLAEGESIGNCRIVRLPQPVTTTQLRLRITESAAPPAISEWGVFFDPAT